MGIGAQEILLLLILGVPVAIAGVVIFFMKRDGNRVAELEAENRRLREELDGRARAEESSPR